MPRRSAPTPRTGRMVRQTARTPSCREPLRRAGSVLTGVVLAAALAGCDPTPPDDAGPAAVPTPDGVASLIVTGPLTDDDTVPHEHTCEGADSRPPLRWEGMPVDAVEVVIVVEDPDAPGGAFAHWLAWGIPADTSGVGETLPRDTAEGTNDFGVAGWRGPCPPEGDEPHRYVVTVLGLADHLDLAEGADADAVLAALEDTTVVAAGRADARYGR